jgi:hypothetical protein
MRTDKEKMDFAKACLMIEKKGGNVQKYIALNWPSYTPRATWYNLQRVYLGRSTNELTEGRPNIEKGDEEMRKQKNSQDETAKGLLDWVRKGRNPATYLAGEGFANPAAALRNIKDYAKKHYSPEIVEEICRITLRGTKTAPAEPKPSENPPEEVKAPETVVVAGKEYEKYEGVKEYPPLPYAADQDIYGKHPVTAYIEKKPSPTCCQPARPSGVTVPDEVPALPEMLTVCGVMGSYGRFEQNIELKGERYMTFVMHMQLTGEDIRITFSADQWKTMLKEIPIALRQLGLSK